MAHPNSHHENNNGGFMADSQTTTNNTSQSRSSSFVGKVRSLLSTSTLTKWFSHTPTANRTGHIRPRTEMEADDSSNDSDDDSEDYNQEQPKVALQPPAKRLKTTINIPTTSSILAESANTSVSNNDSRFSAINSICVDVTMRNPKRLVLNRRNNLNLVQQDSSTTIQNDSDDSGESTSGYSSMPRLTQITKQEKRKALPQDQQQEDGTNATTSTAHTSSSTMINLHNRSLFDTSHDRSLFQSTTSNTFAFNTTAGRPTSLSTRRPAFSGANLSNTTNINSLNMSATSITTVNSGSGLLDRTIATRRICNSPFYSGRTLYGGANNLSMGRCFNQLQGAGTAAENKSKDTDVRDTTSTTTMLSSTARRILDTLESYTLDTTKKMPNTNKKNRRQLRQDHLFASSAKPYNKMGNSRLNDLQVPNVARLLRMKERLQTQTVQVRQMMQQQQQQQQQVADSNHMSTTATTSTGVGGKIRTKVTASARQHKQIEVGLEEDNTEERLSSIQLPISAVPTFTDLYLPLPNLKVSSSSIKPMTSTTGISTTTSIISDPISTSSIITSERTEATTTAPSIVAISINTPPTLAKPAFVSTTVAAVRPVTMTSDTSTSCTLTSSSSSPAISSAVKNVDVVVKKLQPQEIDNKHEHSDQMFVFAKPLVLLDSGLNGSKLRNITAINNFKFSVPLNQMLTHKINKTSSSPTTTDRVDSSCVVNMAADTAAKPPAKAIVASKNIEEKSAKEFGAEFKLSASVQWECNVCLVRNSSSAQICVACTSPKHKPSDNATVATSGWGGIFKPPSNRWECNVCLVSNVNDSTRCVACETPKSGVVASAPSTGTKSSAQWECPSCMVKNQSTAHKCVCCETLQPGVNTTSATVGQKSTSNNLVTKYNFGITPIALSAVSTATSSTNLARGSGFTFDIPPSSVTKTTVTVGISSSTITTGGANMGGTSATPVGFTFGIPAATTTVSAVTAVVPITAASSANNNNGSSSSTVSSTTTLNQQQPQKPIPNGMISSSSGGSPSTFAALVAPGTSSTTNTATTGSSSSSTTTTSVPAINATAMSGIKFGSPLGATTGTATSNLFAFGRPSATPSPVPTQDVSSSTSSSHNTKDTNQPPPNSKTLIAATVVATPTTASSGSFVSSTAVTNAGVAPSSFAPPLAPFHSKVAPVTNPFAFAFNKPTLSTEASASATTTTAVAAATTVPLKKHAPMFSFGSSAAAAAAAATTAASSSTISTTIQQQQQSNGPFMFGAAAATAAPTANSHTGLFSFGAVAGNNGQSSNAVTPSFGFGSQTSTNTAAQPSMNFINALGGNANLFGQPKMKNGGFDFSASLASKPSFQPTTAGFNFTPPGTGTAAQSSHRGLFSFGGSSVSGTGAPAGANGAAAPFTFGAVSSSSSNNDERNKQSINPQPLSFGGITSSSSSTPSAGPHTNIFGTPTPSSATTDNSLGGGGAGSQIQQQRRIIKKAVRRTNTQPR